MPHRFKHLFTNRTPCPKREGEGGEEGMARKYAEGPEIRVEIKTPAAEIDAETYVLALFGMTLSEFVANYRQIKSQYIRKEANEG